MADNSRIQVSNEELLRIAQDTEPQIRQLEQKFYRLKQLMDRTKVYWEGEAAETRRAKFEEQQESIRQTVNSLKGQPVKLREMAGVYVQAESENEAAAQQLLDNVIE